MEKEIRRFDGSIEIRAGTTEGKKTIGGYAVRYNSPTIITDRWGDSWQEEFAVGAFDKSLQNRNQKALWNHKPEMPLGSCKAGTLRFNADVIGLNYDVDTPNNTWGNDAYESVSRGDVDGSSFGFICIRDVWSEVEKDGKKMLKRTVMEAEVFEVSPCTFPAYETSEISCRSKETYKSNGIELRKKKLNLLLKMEGF